MTITADFAWTDERVELLKRYWAAGLTCSQISQRFGGGPSRNAVIGKVSRLRLAKRTDQASRQSPQSRRPKPSRRNYLNFARKPAPPSSERANAVGASEACLPSADDAPLHPPLLISFEDLKREHCRWPLGSTPFHYCGQPREYRAYCAHHARVAYYPIQTRRKQNGSESESSGRSPPRT